MTNNMFIKIDELIKSNKIDEAQTELAKLGNNFLKDPEYLYLRSKVFYINKLYYIAIDTLLIALEFSENNKIFNLISEIYYDLGNKNLSKKFSNIKLRFEAANSLKNELSGIFKEKK